jgi:hypothetical protein
MDQAGKGVGAKASWSLVFAVCGHAPCADPLLDHDQLWSRIFPRRLCATVSSIKVSKFLFCLTKLFQFPPDLTNGFLPNSSPLRESEMAIDVISAERVAAADRREAARAVAHQYLLARAEARRGTRVEEAKASTAARPTPAERAAENPAPLPQRLLDILA